MRRLLRVFLFTAMFVTVAAFMTIVLQEWANPYVLGPVESAEIRGALDSTRTATSYIAAMALIVTGAYIVFYAFASSKRSRRRW